MLAIDGVYAADEDRHPQFQIAGSLRAIVIDRSRRNGQ
jgi:hypothetical protein